MLSTSSCAALLIFRELSPGEKSRERRKRDIIDRLSTLYIMMDDLGKLAGAAVDAGRDALVLEKLTQPPDHPFRLSFPEGEYLKGLICRVVE